MSYPRNTDDPVEGGQLKSLIERIERLDEEAKSISDDKAEIYAEAKAQGYSTKVMKRVIAIRRRDPNERAEEDAITDLYLQAVGESRATLPSGTKPATRTVAPVKPVEQVQRLPGNEELAYQDVKAIVLAERNPSTSFVQRRFGIGFNRASAFLERMEADGLVGPFSNGKRELLVAPEVKAPTLAETQAELNRIRSEEMARAEQLGLMNRPDEVDPNAPMIADIFAGGSDDEDPFDA